MSCEGCSPGSLPSARELPSSTNLVDSSIQTNSLVMSITSLLEQFHKNYPIFHTEHTKITFEMIHMLMDAQIAPEQKRRVCLLFTHLQKR